MQEGDLRRLSIQRDELELTIVPELGAKIERLARRGGANVLFPAPGPVVAAGPSSAFEEHAFGWDECFPSVAAAGDVPDHGELWSLPWSAREEGGALVCEVRGSVTPCLFRRRLEVRGRTLRLDYEIVSEADRVLEVIWSAHPLLAASPGSEIVLPRSLGEIRVLGPRQSGLAEKLFSDRLDEGRCAYLDRATGQAVTFRFDPALVPYLGLWISEDGWPTTRDRKDYTLALEPCLAPCDSLAEARERGLALALPPRGRHAFWLEVAL